MLNQIGYLVSRTRRNHGLEHATIHILSDRHKNFSAQGNSNHRGFHLNIYGDDGEDDVRAAVEEAYRRMKSGDHHLAVHPNCGTVLLTTAAMGALASQTAFGLEQRRQRRRNMDLNVFLNGLPGAIWRASSALFSRGRRYGHSGKADHRRRPGNLRVVGVRETDRRWSRFFQCCWCRARPAGSFV